MSNSLHTIYYRLALAATILALRDDGMTLRMIADLFNQREVRSPKKKFIKWSPARISKIEKEYTGLHYDIAVQAIAEVGAVTNLEDIR